MEFSAKHYMYQIGYPADIISKLQLYYVTGACVTTMQGEQHKG